MRGNNMKRVYVKEEWCLGCHLCEYNCAYANSGVTSMVKALKDKPIFPRIRVEDCGKITYAVSCRHCEDPLCIKGCISGALHKENGVVVIDKTKCVGCYTCVLLCPYGAVMPSPDGTAAQKCELCANNSFGEPSCVKGCPNRAIVYEER